MLLLGLVDVPMWLMLIIAIAALLYWYGTRNHNFYKKNGISGPKPLPFIGNMHEMFDFMNVYTDYKKKYGKTIGTFSGCTPTLVVFDEDMISQFMVKQFSNFMNKQVMKNGDPIQENMLTSLENETWKHVRSTMSPTFTTGKLKQMTDEINRCAKQLADKLATTEGQFETRELAAAFSMDAIASIAFGLRVDSQSSSDNQFNVNGKRFVDVKFTNPVLIVGWLIPPLGRLFVKMGLSFWDLGAVNFFVDIVKQAMGTRTEADKNRTDFLQLMYNARQGQLNYSKDDEHEVQKLATGDKKIGLTEDEVLSNALVFFLAGYDNISVGLTMLMYSLATNPDIQQKVHEEIDTILADKDSPSYDDIQKLTYLDQCLQESFRLYPGNPVVDRVANNETELNGVPIPKDSVVVVPVYAIHMDPEIYPEPEKFDPERFTAEEKAKRNSVFYMPFGYGPRQCIGMRLVLYEVKVAIVYMLKHHKLVTCSKTEKDIKWKSGMWLKAENGIWLTAEKRK